MWVPDSHVIGGGGGNGLPRGKQIAVGQDGIAGSMICRAF